MTSPVAPLSLEYSRFRRRLLLGLLTLACLVIVVVAWKICSSFRERENAARTQTQTYAYAIAAYVSDSIQLVDFSLIGFANTIKVLPPKSRYSTATIRQLLERHDPSPSNELLMMFVDANGIVIAASKNATVEQTSFADRDWFQAHTGTHVDQDLYVGEPVVAKVSEKRIFTLSRRVVDAQGQFLGVVVAPLDAARLASMFERARFDKAISISLVHGGGKVMARAPLFEQSFATSLLNSEAFRKMRDVPTTFQANSPFGGQPMIYSVRPLENTPLNIFVGISVQALNQSLQQDLLIGGAGITLMLALMFLGAFVALNGYRSQEINKRALQESEFRWKFALEGSGQGVWDWNVLTNEVLFSSSWKNMLGYAEDDIENRADAWECLLYPDDKLRVMAAILACLQGKTPLYVSEYRMRCKDGSWKWILSRGMVVSRDGAGRALRMIGTHADISNRKKAERAQVHKIVDAAPDPMLLVDNDGGISFANGAAQSTFGYTLNELLGQNVNNLVPFNSRSSHAHLRSVVESNRNPYPWPLTARHKDGTEFPVEISLSTIQMDGQPVTIANIRDISESRRAAELLQQSFTQLRQLSDHQQNIKEVERKRIAQDIHDDLGQNLLALKMDVTMLLARTGEAHPKLHNRARVVLHNIDATIKSVKTIMNDLRPATLELGLYPAVEWQLKQFERRNGIACKLASNAPEAGFGLDEARTSAVFRILQESLANVARHAEATEVEIVLSQDERGFSMKVRDNGIGLQPGDRRKTNSFGLIGIRERIDSLGGQLIIASRPGQGTLLSISIPLTESRMES